MVVGFISKKIYWLKLLLLARLVLEDCLVIKFNQLCLVLGILILSVVRVCDQILQALVWPTIDVQFKSIFGFR